MLLQTKLGFIIRNLRRNLTPCNGIKWAFLRCPTVSWGTYDNGSFGTRMEYY